MPRTLLFAIALAALAALALLAGCGSQTPQSPAPRQTVVIGVDAMDWQVVDPLLEAGKLPNLAALMEQSASGVNLSFVPLEKSPRIWASMATGLMPDEHGIGGFLKDKTAGHYEGLSSAADWRSPAIWDIGGAAGLQSCVIGWWVTYPARAIEGVMVSDHYTYTDQGSRNPEGWVQPAGLVDELQPLSVRYDEVPLELLRILVPGAPEELLLDVDDERMRELRIILAGDLTYLNTARHLAAQGQYDFFAVYLRGLDLMCHKFWRFMDHGDGPAAADDEVALLGQAVPNYLLLVDRWLGEMLTWFPAEANLMVMSDHGFYGPRRDRAGFMRKGVHEHRPEGVVIMRSKLYQPGQRFERTFIMNVGPTLLAMLGLPPSQEMAGRVIREAMAEEALPYVEHLEQHRLETYAGLAPAPPEAVADDPALDAAVKKQLRSLGYVD